MTPTTGTILDAAPDDRLRTAIIATRYGAKSTWQRNSLLARRQRETESWQHAARPVPPVLKVIEARPAGRRSILGFVGDRHFLVALWTKLAYALESVSAFDPGPRGSLRG